MKNFKLLLSFIFMVSINVNASDTLIKNGTIHIGDGSEAFVGDIYIKNGVINSIGNLDIDASITIDAEGKIITPGFIAPMTAVGIIEIGSLDVTRDDAADYLNMGFSIFRAFNPNSTPVSYTHLRAHET